MILARYPTDLTDTQWAAPLIPAARAGGRPRTTDMREVDHAGRPIPLLVSEIQAATTNAGARPQGGLTPVFLALSERLHL
jgi:transposase